MDPALCREVLDPLGSHEPRMAPQAGAGVSSAPEIEPLILSLKQRDFYLVPAIPFFAISAGYFLIKPIQLLTALISQSILNLL